MNVRHAILSITTLLLIPLALLTAFVISSGVSKSQSQKPQQVDERKLVEAIRRGGYKEAAKLKGHYVGTVDPNWDWASFDLETLTKTSAGVIVGVPSANTAELSSNGDMIMTSYEVQIEEVIKGDFVPGSTVRVSVPGGKVDFEDGTSAELQTPGFEPMVNGGKYVLFLYANRNGSSVFLLTGGPQGLFELEPTGKIKAHGRATDPAVKEVQTKEVKGFLNELRLYARKWSQSQGCCG